MLLSGPSLTQAHPGRWWMERGTWPAQIEPADTCIKSFTLHTRSTYLYKSHVTEIK